MNRYDERLDENGVGPIEYLLFNLASILFLIEDPQPVKSIIATIFAGVMKDSEDNKSTQSMFNKTALVQTSINKILINMTPYNRWQIQNKAYLNFSSSSYQLIN